MTGQLGRFLETNSKSEYFFWNVVPYFRHLAEDRGYPRAVLLDGIQLFMKRKYSYEYYKVAASDMHTLLERVAYGVGHG